MLQSFSFYMTNPFYSEPFPFIIVDMQHAQNMREINERLKRYKIIKKHKKEFHKL